ncbi:hypothetical protein ACQ4PT_032354 [Festuca glaucescens]
MPKEHAYRLSCGGRSSQPHLRCGGADRRVEVDDMDGADSVPGGAAMVTGHRGRRNQRPIVATCRGSEIGLPEDIKFPNNCNPSLDSKPSIRALDLARPPQQWRPSSRYGSPGTLAKPSIRPASPLIRPAPLLFQDPSKLSVYRDRRFPGTQEDFEAALLASLTVYVGNMSFYSTEEQAYELFSRAGEIKKIIMGLDKNTKTPCGFCFVLYYSREDAEDAVKYISGTMLDDRPIRVDFDWGFQEGRQWGRGRSGGQVRDEYRTDYDPGRGGYGKMVQKELEAQRELVDYGVGFQTNAPPQFDRADRKRGYNDRNDRDYQRRRSGPDTSRRAPDSDSKRDANQEPEKNPRFREKGDSDEEDDDYDKKRRR